MPKQSKKQKDDVKIQPTSGKERRARRVAKEKTKVRKTAQEVKLARLRALEKARKTRLANIKKRKQDETDHTGKQRTSRHHDAVTKADRGAISKLPPALVRDFKLRLAEQCDEDAIKELHAMITGQGRWKKLGPKATLEAIELAFMYAYGKPKEMVEVSGPNGGPVTGALFVAGGDSEQYIAALRAARGESPDGARAIDVTPGNGAA